MQLITTPSELSAVFKELLISCVAVHVAVAWASIGFPEYDALVKAKRKIGRAVIGTHFYQTDPRFIKEFSGNECVRFVRDHSGLFHPKLYVFEHQGGGWACIVGSANFTAGGFGKNREISFLVTDADDPGGMVLKKALTSIDHYWDSALPGVNIDIRRYCEMKERFARPLAHAAGQFGAGEPGRPVEEIAVLNLNWDEFFSQVRNDGRLAKRLDVLRAARDLFLQYGTFAKMPIEDRQGVAGFRRNDKVPWGWFGSMQGAGTFKNLVNHSPNALSDALDQVPLDGHVIREDYLEFVARFVHGFPLKDGKHTRHGLGTATRLLAMKRPDYFVCLDGANRHNLLDEFNVKMSRHDYDGYWDKIVERVKLATWWNARRPSESNAGQVWDGRVAMLDAIYYTADT